MTKSYSIRGVDGNDLTVSETIGGQEVVISIQNNNERGAIDGAVRLDEDQFCELCALKYDLRFKPAPQPAAQPAKPVEPRDTQPLSEAAF